ncbi:amiloride-sensitive sodium channel domain-containing protein [Ditylenchus destructor]|nr:amiloride-sensitive sodium channel domain-containing protein [Ditylenchus destructor]
MPWRLYCSLTIFFHSLTNIRHSDHRPGKVLIGNAYDLSTISPAVYLHFLVLLMATHGLKAPAPPVNKSALYVQKQPQKELEQPQWKHQQHDAGLRDIVRNFSAWASIDGIPHIVLTENWILRILWIIITTACFGAAIYQLITLIIQYFKYPVDLLTSIEFTPLAVPTVTLCNINPWKRSQIRDTPLEDLVTAYESFDASAEYGFESPPTEAKQWRAKNWMWLMGDVLIEMDRNGTAPIGYDWDDLFISCTYNSDPCNASDFIDFYDVYYGHCYMFNVNGTQTSTRAGPAYGLRLVMRIVQQEYLPWIASMGAVVFMDRAGATPFEEIYGYYASVGEASEFGVHYIERSKLSKPFSNCTNSIQGVSQKIYYFNDYEVLCFPVIINLA